MPPPESNVTVKPVEADGVGVAVGFDVGLGVLFEEGFGVRVGLGAA